MGPGTEVRSLGWQGVRRPPGAAPREKVDKWYQPAKGGVRERALEVLSLIEVFQLAEVGRGPSKGHKQKENKAPGPSSKQNLPTPVTTIERWVAQVACVNSERWAAWVICCYDFSSR